MITEVLLTFLKLLSVKKKSNERRFNVPKINRVKNLLENGFKSF